MNALEYHERTKHFFNRFARSAGVLDWATQPDPFRRFDGAPGVALSREPAAPDVPYSALFEGAPVLPVTLHTLSEFLRCAMGLSAWKRYEATRWPLRVNPSSGNLHPTETYVVWAGRVLHYAVREHALEERCALTGTAPRTFDSLCGSQGDPFLVGLTSIHWREAWKYGERAFRYCQHDLGHAIAALRLSAARLGWQLQLLTGCPDRSVAAVLGLDRDSDFADAERESPECLALVSTGGKVPTGEAASAAVASLIEAAGHGVWTGVANRLSRGHRDWPVIDQVAAATGRESWGDPGSPVLPSGSPRPVAESILPGESASARALVLQRRSAVAFNPRSKLPVDALRRILGRLLPGAPPWDAVDWPLRVHLVLFIHRVDGLTPGMYAFTRAAAVRAEWQRAMRADFLWEPQPAFTADGGELSLLLPMDMTWPATRVSCDQDIAGDGYFSLAMLARTGDIAGTGEWLYRQLFWEAGMIGQMLYLEAEVAGSRGTGIGCFYDDAVHEILGLPHPATSATWQSLYHFSVGEPIEDTRLTTEPGYDWEPSNSEPSAHVDVSGSVL